MEVFLLIMLFIMGTVFGSFFTLAVYRIPLKKDITHERSFCPKCNHRLEFLDLIPVWSYIFLKGKCRYCGDKIRPRYFIFEILSGIVFVLVALSLNVENIYLELYKGIYFIQFVFLYITLIITAGIDKEYRKINSSVLLFGVITQTLYIIYLYMFETQSIYRYGIYLVIFIIMYILNLILSHKKKELYAIQILLLYSYILFVFGFINSLLICLITLIGCVIYKLIIKVKFSQIQVGFIVGIIGITYKILENIYIYYLI